MHSPPTDVQREATVLPRYSHMLIVVAYSHFGQHKPFVVVGAVSVPVHIVGKHHTLSQKVLASPPFVPVAPFTFGSILMLGFTQYGQQWPSTDSTRKPAGHFRSDAHVMLAHGSLMPLFWTKDRKSLSAFTVFSCSVDFC